MKIIKRGLKRKIEKQFGCRRCGSTLSATRAEGEYIQDPRLGESCIKYRCPVCGSDVYTSAEGY